LAVVDFSEGGGKAEQRQCVLEIMVVIRRLGYVIDVRMSD